MDQDRQHATYEQWVTGIGRDRYRHDHATYFNGLADDLSFEEARYYLLGGHPVGRKPPEGSGLYRLPGLWNYEEGRDAAVVAAIERVYSAAIRHRVYAGYYSHAGKPGDGWVVIIDEDGAPTTGGRLVFRTDVDLDNLKVGTEADLRAVYEKISGFKDLSRDHRVDPRTHRRMPVDT